MDWGTGYGAVWIPRPQMLREPDPPGWPPPATLCVALTQAQCTVARRLLAGYTAREIGALLSRSPRTIESHIEGMKSRLGCYSRAELIVALVGLGIEALR